jgi:hypothetical protein
MTHTELILCALGAYLAMLLVIAIVMLVLVPRLYWRMPAADDADTLTRDDHALLKREATRVLRATIDELREEARR